MCSEFPCEIIVQRIKMLKTKLEKPLMAESYKQETLYDANGGIRYGVYREADTKTDRVMAESPNMPLTLCEIKVPEPFRFFDYFNIEQSVWLNNEKCVMVDVYATFLEKQREMKLNAKFINKDTGELVGEADMEQAKDFNNHRAYLFADIGENDPSNLAVAVTADISHSSGGHTRLYAAKPILGAKAVPFDLSPRYEHIYPKKEPVTIIFGTDTDRPIKPATYEHDPNYITISLYRQPKLSGDSDYICNYGHGSGGNAILGIPSKGIIKLGRSAQVEGQLNNAQATIQRIDKGGKALTTNKFLAPKVSNGDLQYEVETNWQHEIDQPGDLQPFYYNYELSFIVTYRLNASTTSQQLQFTVTSKHDMRAVSNSNSLIYNIPPLKIMWGCLAKDTLIRMGDGTLKKIEDISVGNAVQDGRNGRPVTVRNIWKGEEEKLVRIAFGNGEIRLTKDHPVFTLMQSKTVIKRASEVNQDDILIGPDEQQIKVESVEVVDYNDQVYNLTLEGDSHCFVANDILTGDMDMQNGGAGNE